MTIPAAPRLAKWPFFLADAILLALAWWLMDSSSHPLPPWSQSFVVASVVAALGFGVWPFVLEYQAALKFAEADGLTTAVAEIGNLESIADQIRTATSQWQTVQDHSARTVSAAGEITQRMTAEAKAFAEFMAKANDAERGHLRLEVEKLRRAESDWLQMLIHLLDHVYALNQAGARSGHPNVREQLGMFQSACRDVVRRIGLLPLEATPGDAFDEKLHQLPDPEAKAPATARIAETLATGYTFQGQLLRRPHVRLQEAAAAPKASTLRPAAPAVDVAAGFQLEVESLPTAEAETTGQS